MYQNSYQQYLYQQYPYTSNYAYYPQYPTYNRKSKKSRVTEQPGIDYEVKEISETQLSPHSIWSDVNFKAETEEQQIETTEKEEVEVTEVNTITKHFLNYLGERKGTVVSVTTSTGVINGTLEEVASDCILVKANEESYHIRPEGIIYFK